MAASLWKRLLRPSVLHRAPELSGPTFEVDWSVISPGGLGMLFKELLAHLLGAPPPADLHKGFYALDGHRMWGRKLNIEDIYFQRHFIEGVETGFLVRGVIFDMPALIEASRDVIPVPKRWEDWTTMLDFSTPDKMKPDEQTVHATEVMEKLGLKGVASLEGRLTAAKKAEQKEAQSKLEEKQAMEEVLGTGDSIRAKYMLKIKAKKLAADARREQGNLEIMPASGPRMAAGGRTWQAAPGAFGLVRYLEERGVSRALLARGEEGDLPYLLDQLGNHKFQQVTEVRVNQDDPGSGELLSNGLFKSICGNLGLPAKQVMVVIGEGPQSDAVLEVVADSGFFVCRLSRPPPEPDTQASASDPSDDQSGLRKQHTFFLSERNLDLRWMKSGKAGVVSWFNRLAEGTLHVDETARATGGGNVHFSVADMTELKWVIEDLNGTSYRRNTFLTGSEPAAKSTSTSGGIH